MPPKRRKFESTFPAARIKKIMQLDDDVGRVASSVPVLISRAVEIFLQALLTRTADHASSRNAKTLSVNHLKYCIEREKQWDFLKDLTANISDVGMEEEGEEGAPKKSRKRRHSPKAPASKRRQAAAEAVEEPYESSGGEEDGSEPGDEAATNSTFLAPPRASFQPTAPFSTASAAGLSPLSALASSLSSSGPSPPQLVKPSPLTQLAALSTAHTPDVSPLAALSSSLKQQQPSSHADEEDYDV